MTKRIYEIEHRECSADLLPELRDVYARARQVTLPIERFRWFYLENPSGRAHLLLARDRSGQPVGMSVAIPHRCQKNGRYTMAWNTVDFCVVPEHRTLGLAVQLRRAVLEAAAERAVEVVFSHPAPETLPVHQRSGMTCTVANRRFVLPVSIRALAEARYNSSSPARIVAAAVGALADGFARGPGIGRARARRVGWSEAAALLSRLPRPYRQRALSFVVDRDFLIWRFARCPRYECQAYACWLDDQPLAVAVVGLLQQTAWLKLLEPMNAPCLAIRALTATMVQSLRRHGIRTISAVLPAGHALEAVLTRSGFWPQSDPSLTLWHSPANSQGSPATWNRLVCDRDL